jgi:hypothetical protein
VKFADVAQALEGLATMSAEDSQSVHASTRREFLQQAATATGSMAPLSGALSRVAVTTANKPNLLPAILLGNHRVTRLIIGGNPVYGYSHFNKLLSQHQIAWHTPERVTELLQRCVQAGINTWQNSYAERSIADVDRFRSAGINMHWLCLGKPDWDVHSEHIKIAAKHKPIGIAPHGHLAERLHRQGKLNLLTDLLKRIRDEGVLVGLSAHNPALIELADEKGWDVDYYMCCLYYLTRPRSEFEKLLGKDLPLGEIYLPSDPPRMFKTIQSTRKPCLAYKVLAAGRRVDSPTLVRQGFAAALRNIKPTDALIVGMYQQLGDQVGENSQIVRELLASRAS